MLILELLAGDMYQRGGQPRKRIPRATAATLEKVFSTCHWPSDEILNSLWELHHLPRNLAIDWFAERRRQEIGFRESLLDGRR